MGQDSDMSNREIHIANLYHESTKLLYLDLERKPPAYKRYRALSPLPLPTDFAPPAVPALAAIADAVHAAEATSDVNCETLAGLLFFSAGRIKTRHFAGAGEVTFRAASSAGGLYPIEVYVVCGALPGLEAGVYHFSPADFALRCLRQGDYRAALARAAGGDQTVAQAPSTLVFTAMFWRSAWKYRVRSYRYCLWDNGTMLANLLATAAVFGVPVRVTMGFVDDQVNQLLGLDGQHEASICLLPLGQPADLPSQAEPLDVSPLVVETIPSPVEEIDYPELRQIHAASVLTTPEEVAAWGGRLDATPVRGTGPLYPLKPFEATTTAPLHLHDVICQRGSTRRFERQPIALSQLSAILSHATTGIAADFLGQDGASLLHIYLIVNAVQDLPAGSYVFTVPEQALELLQAGDLREESGHLCFEQALGADASVVVFFMADLERVLQRFGNRGYRAVQVEAGIIGGKMYLGAYSLGLGASGLTFYDGDVTAFFSPHAAGKSAIFVVALGLTARENRVRPYRSRVAMRRDALSRKDG
jgi:SagB-type dehydrogenase family enzyme